MEYGAVLSSPTLAPLTQNSIFSMKPAGGVASALIVTDEPIGTIVLSSGLVIAVPVAKYRTAGELTVVMPSVAVTEK